MQARFYLERRKDAGGKLLLKDRPVFMSVSLGGDRVMIGTGVKSDFSAWDRVNQRKKNGFPGAPVDNAWLNALSETAQQAHSALQTGDQKVSAELFLHKFKQLRPKYNSGFFDVFYRFMQDGTSRWADTTFRKVKTIYHQLKEFEDQKRGRITFQQVDDAFLKDFIAFYREKGNHINTTRKAVNIIVWFLNWATREGYNHNTTYRGFYKKLGPAESQKRVYPYLEWDELMRLSGQSLQNRKQERIRDMYCFMCFTGLRYSELQSLLKQDIKGEELVTRSNGRKSRKIPMNERARAIWKRYSNKYYLNNVAFPPVNSVTFNKHLKQIARVTGLNRRVLMMYKDDEYQPVHEVLTVGTAVNTFIHNALQLNIPAHLISHYTGVRHDRRIHVLLSAMSKEEIRKFN